MLAPMRTSEAPAISSLADPRLGDHPHVAHREVVGFAQQLQSEQTSGDDQRGAAGEQGNPQQPVKQLAPVARLLLLLARLHLDLLRLVALQVMLEVEHRPVFPH